MRSKGFDHVQCILKIKDILCLTSESDLKTKSSRSHVSSAQASQMGLEPATLHSHSSQHEPLTTMMMKMMMMMMTAVLLLLTNPFILRSSRSLLCYFRALIVQFEHGNRITPAALIKVLICGLETLWGKSPIGFIILPLLADNVVISSGMTKFNS